eukprot:8241728-Ditylum_brightwellii.AAC.1
MAILVLSEVDKGCDLCEEMYMVFVEVHSACVVLVKLFSVVAERVLGINNNGEILTLSSGCKICGGGETACGIE